MQMAEENIFFLKVKEVCQKDVVTCSPDDPLVDVAALMRLRNISGVVVCEGKKSVGIFTDRDLRNKVVSRGEDPRPLTVRSVMNTPLIVVDEDEFLFEVVYRMSRHNIHRVGVVDSAGRLTGIITDSDILRLQTRSPQQMVKEIEAARGVEDLKNLHSRVQELVAHLVGTGVQTRDLVRMISHLNDQILVRLITLLRKTDFSDLTDRFAFVVLGSEGRREQTLTTDQDNALICADDLNEVDIHRLEEFSRKLNDSLIAIGVPECPGGIMAKNEAWRQSVSGWTRTLSRWLSSSTPENILNTSMFSDIRTIYGDPSLARALKTQLIERLQGDSTYMMRMAANVMGFPPPLGFFGRIKVERKGVHRGLLDVKKAGIFAITEGVKILSLEAGVLEERGTRERIQLLVEMGVLRKEDAEDLDASFHFLVHVRLRGQVEAVRKGKTPTNYVALDQLNRMEKGRLRLALEGVASFQAFLQLHFSLDLLR
jgi:CBS domain-containing protein